MSEEEQIEVRELIREYLKKELKVKIKLCEDPDSIGVKVKIFLAGKVIAQNFNELHEEDQGWF